MRKFVCLFMLVLALPMWGCGEQTDGAPREALFTIPFSKNVTVGVADVRSYAVTVVNNVEVPILAPNHAKVAQVWDGGLELMHFREPARLVLDGFGGIGVEEGDFVCAGYPVGYGREARVMAFWEEEGEEESEEEAVDDLAMVRIIRDNHISDLSKAEMYETVKSVLGLDEQLGPSSTDVNRDPCPYTEEEENE